MINVLIIGSGGRENALAYTIYRSPHLKRLFCLPGNPGTAHYAHNITASLSDFESIKSVIIENEISLVVVGPEDPLVNGLKDYLSTIPECCNVGFIGPGKEGARLEGSKDFAKEFMKKNSIPTANYCTFNRGGDEEAFLFLSRMTPPYVIKADGLAAGKGVIIAEDYKEACNSVSDILNGKFGVAGSKIVIEEFLDGIEASVFVLTDGDNYMILPTAKDYKRAFDGDKGLNTGGMGAVSPVPFADNEFMHKVRSRIVEPTIKGLNNEGIKYCGFLFIGLMNCGGNPYVIEYNVRMGDPETEVVMPRINSDFLSHLIAAVNGTLSQEKLEVSDKTAVTVVIASGGYPLEYKKGCKIEIPENMDDIIVFHSGTINKNGELLTNGGRVLAVTSLGNNIVDARNNLYSSIDKIGFENSFYRKDIGKDLIDLQNY